MLRNNGDNIVSVADDQALLSAIGETIHSIKIKDNKIVIKFTNRKGIEIWDNGQSCCEARYLVCDDELEHHIGGTFLELEVLDVESEDVDNSYSYGTHEIQFLKIKTSKGFVKFSNHNEHNGYYGGFGLAVKEI